MIKLIPYYFLLLLTLSVNSGMAQENDLQDSIKIRQIQLTSYLVLEADAPFPHFPDSVIHDQIPLAIIPSKDSNKNKAFFESLTNNFTPIIIISEEVNNSAPNSPEIDFIPISKIETLDFSLLQTEGDSSRHFYKPKKFIQLNIKEEDVVSDSLLFKTWAAIGRMPNFIHTTNLSPGQAVRIVSTLNSVEKVFGEVKTRETDLEDVFFKNYHNRKANGFFCFPIIPGEGLPVLIPHKAGYHFSPDIIFTTRENSGNSKEFIGFPLEQDFGLSDHFVFDKTVQNVIRKNDEKILSNNVEIVQDSSLGTVGYFNNRAYIDTGLESRSALKSSFTITAWIKPTSISHANSILGKGDNFVVKIHRGYLTFTMAGINDYMSKSSPIPLNEWTHIGVVHSSHNNELRYYINGKLTENVKLIQDYVTSDYNLLIGNNLWEEFFVGYLDDIKIWERELNSHEVKAQFKLPADQHPKSSLIAVIIISILAIIVTYTFLIFKRESKKRQLIQQSPILSTKKIIPAITPATISNSIYCFGPLKIINKDGEDISHKLSPKLKMLFITLLLHSIDNKKGITSKKLTEILWPGMSPQSAKNTRGTNIQNLRSLLTDCEGISLVFKEKRWFLEMTSSWYCDYKEAKTLLNLYSTTEYSVPELEQNLPVLLTSLKKGTLFPGVSDSWLDGVIEKFSNEVIEQCWQFTQKLNISKNGDLLFNIAEVIYLYDDLNEKALWLKLQVLKQQGKLSLAHSAYSNFIKLYEEIYKEVYPVSFEDLASSDHFVSHQ